MSDWTPPQHWTAEVIEYWKSLDHDLCTRYGLNFDAPAYEQCHSMHCPQCGKRTGGQGHLKRVGDDWLCPTPEAERKPWPGQ